MITKKWATEEIDKELKEIKKDIEEIKKDIGYSLVRDDWGYFFPICFWKHPDISITQRFNAICEYLNIEVVKQEKEEKVIAKKKVGK